MTSTNTPQVDGLTEKQEMAIVALLNEPTIKAAAERVGIGERTIHRWLDEDRAFSAAYSRARRQAFRQAVALTQKYAPLAINVLAKVMTDPASSASAKVSAASAILHFSRESIEMDDLAGRIDTLEEQARTVAGTSAHRAA